MKFNFQVGDTEKHNVSFYFDKFLSGKTIIKVDDKDVFNAGTTLVKESFKTVREPIKFSVGDKEKHEVKIAIKATVPVFSGFFPYKYQTYIDGELTNTYSGWL